MPDLPYKSRSWSSCGIPAYKEMLSDLDASRMMHRRDYGVHTLHYSDAKMLNKSTANLRESADIEHSSSGYLNLMYLCCIVVQAGLRTLSRRASCWLRLPYPELADNILRDGSRESFPLLDQP